MWLKAFMEQSLEMGTFGRFGHVKARKDHFIKKKIV